VNSRPALPPGVWVEVLFNLLAPPLGEPFFLFLGGQAPQNASYPRQRQ